MMRIYNTLLIIVLLLAAHPASSDQGIVYPSDMLVGGEFTYTVKRGDSLTSVGARFGVDAWVLARENGLRPTARLKIGQELRVNHRHIVPPPIDDGILINLPQRMLFYFAWGTLASAYPVGLGRPDWPTPIGHFTLVSKEQHPVWDVPLSIQEEMRRSGKIVRTRVLPGPDNPLGTHWLGLSLPGYGIHGTIAPATIYRFRSHGCIRLHPDDIADLFTRVALGTPGKAIYAPVLLALLPGNQVFLEVHRDIYRQGEDPWTTVQRLAATWGLGPLMDWQRVAEVIERQEGAAREVTLQSVLSPR